MRIKDFSLDMYAEICKALQAHPVVTVQSYLTNMPQSPCIVLRHDVDRNPGNALDMAELEYKFGIQSTYYFRYPNTFNVEIMERIRNLGHEIGYHYEVLDKARGDCKKALGLFKKELAIFRAYFPVKTVCMHGNPLTEWDGRDIWKAADFRDYGIIGEAFLSFKDISAYLTDTGRNWNGHNNFKDRLRAGPQENNFRSTPDVIRFINGYNAGHIYLNCHPERWAPGLLQWSASSLRDHFFNLCKKAIRRFKANTKERIS